MRLRQVCIPPWLAQGKAAASSAAEEGSQEEENPNAHPSGERATPCPQPNLNLPSASRASPTLRRGDLYIYIDIPPSTVEAIAVWARAWHGHEIETEARGLLKAAYCSGQPKSLGKFIACNGAYLIIEFRGAGSCLRDACK